MRTRCGTRLARPVCALLLGAALLAGACTDANDADPSSSGTQDPDTPSDDPGAPAGGTSIPIPDEVPDTPAGEQLTWILTAIHPDGARPTPGQVADRLGPPLDGMITPGQLLRTFEELQDNGPWELVNQPNDGVQLTAELRNEHDDTVLINLSVGDEGQMIGLFVAGDDD